MQLNELDTMRAMSRSAKFLDAELSNNNFDLSKKITNHQDWTVTRFAIDEKRLDTLEVIAKHGHDFNLKDNLGKTEFASAVECGLPRNTLVDMINNGANIDARDRYGNTPTHYAVDARNSGQVGLLIEAEADINQTNARKESPLHRCCLSGDKKSFDLLMNAGAEINKQDIFGNSPLHNAVKSGNLEICKELINKGIDTSLKDRQGRTASDLAINSGKKDVEEYFTKESVEENVLTERKRRIGR